MQTFVYLVYLSSLSNCINVFVWHNSSIRKHGYDSFTIITIQFGESLQSKLSSSELLLLHTGIVHVFWCPHQTQHLRFQTSFRPEDLTDWVSVQPSYDLLLKYLAIFTESRVVSYIVIEFGQRFTHVDSCDDIFYLLIYIYIACWCIYETTKSKNFDFCWGSEMFNQPATNTSKPV